ncbi:MAG: hypothetical protein K8E66_02095 [Phycisphaerales bacterium]|nr:hypothetical protein [Phycisphaerales bacterium]
MNKAICASVIALTAGSALAGTNDILVEIHGEIWGNQLRVSSLATVNPGDTMTISFELDSANFLNSANFPTRGYEIDQASYVINFSGGQSIGLLNPWVDPVAPYFVIRESDPVSDGFFMAPNLDYPYPNLDLNENGQLGPLNQRFDVSYEGSTLTTLNIIDAVGSYDYTGLQVFGLGIGDGFVDDVVGIDYTGMTISYIPAPASIVGLVSVGLFAARRRR